MKKYISSYQAFESNHGPVSVYGVTVGGEVVAILHDKEMAWVVANKYGTDMDGNPVADVVVYPDVDTAIDAYGGENYLGKSATHRVKRGGSWSM